MPVPPGTIFRYKKGTKIRLAINKGKVIETKDMSKSLRPKIKPN